MNGLASGTGELAIRLMWTGWHNDTARALRSKRILTQNRHPLLLNAPLLAGISPGYEP
jgi:hypothetical protein